MLIQGNCVKRVLGSTALTLEARAGESFLIRRIYCEPNDDDEYLVLRVDRKTVGVYRTYGRGGNHLQHIGSDIFALNIMAFLEANGINVTVPVAEGQTFSIDGIQDDTEIVVVFDTYSATDITSIMPNGSDAKDYIFLQYMTSTIDLAAIGDLLLDVSLSPAEFPDFPCGKVVPARHTIEMLGLVGNPWHDGGDFGDVGYTTFVKLVKDREILFDPDRLGIPFRGKYRGRGYSSYLPDFSLIGGVFQPPDYGQTPPGDYTEPGKPLLFNPVLSFAAGEELLIYLSGIMEGVRTVKTTNVDLAAILHVKVE